MKARDIDLIMYADDGFLVADFPFKPTPPKGFEFAEEKSRWVKEFGEWKVPSVTFLGLQYDSKTGLLKGNTRKGSTLEFGPNQLELLE